MKAGELVHPAPGYPGRFRGNSELPGVGVKSKDEIVVQMERLALARGNTVNVHANQNRLAGIWNHNRRFLHGFAARSVTQLYIILFDVTTRQ